jgi:hypothetical protein
MWQIEVDRGKGAGWQPHVLDLATKQKAIKEQERLRPILEVKFGWATRVSKEAPRPAPTRQPASLARMMNGGR